MTGAGTAESIGLVCPECHGSLLMSPDEMRCVVCARVFGYESGFPNLIIGGRFEDENNTERTLYEEISNDHTVRHYLLPAFEKMFSGRERPRLLSLGCGTGIDVDILSDAGFDIVGIDCGNRCDVWPRRKERGRLYLANGMKLPFGDNVFDAVYCGCVFPHVGTEGESDRVRPSYLEERLAIAREMSRVLKQDGNILVSSPNRRCPVDIFHGRSKDNPLPRWNRPANPFLLSQEDYISLFRTAGCNLFRLLPVKGYWGFVNRRQKILGSLLVSPVEGMFRLVSTETFGFLRASAVSPWLVMQMRKAQTW